MCLTSLLRISDPLLQNLLCLFNKLSVKIDSVACDFADSIVLAEDVF